MWCGSTRLYDTARMTESVETIIGAALREESGRLGSGIVSAYVFGSQATGRTHRESDVDVAVLLDRATFPSRAERFEQRLRISGVLSRALARNDVDLLLLNDAPAPLAARIVMEGHPVFCSDSEADRRFRRDAMLIAADLRPFLRRMERLALKTLRR
jgi:predicted nucleotidyltransferase